MRIANVDGRLALLVNDRAIDVATASKGRFQSDPQAVYPRWEEFRRWADTAGEGHSEPFAPLLLGAPSPRPAQVLAVGNNYGEHAREIGVGGPATGPPVFTKFPSCITGAYGEVYLPSDGRTDWEVELVVVIGRRFERGRAKDAWAHVAGLAVGQDLSERRFQMAGPTPQFSLAKSFPRFGPVGPWLVTPDEFENPDDLYLRCSVNGECMQEASTGQLLYGVPAIMTYLSAVVPLFPGDVIFTGTPPGVGMGRVPQRWLAPGDELVSSIDGIGEMRHRFRAEND